MPPIAVSRKQEGADGRQPAGQHKLHPASEHQRRSCSYRLLLRGSDQTGALHRRLLFLPTGQTVARLPLTEETNVHAKGFACTLVSRDLSWRKQG